MTYNIIYRHIFSFDSCEISYKLAHIGLHIGAHIGWLSQNILEIDRLQEHRRSRFSLICHARHPNLLRVTHNRAVIKHFLAASDVSSVDIGRSPPRREEIDDVHFQSKCLGTAAGRHPTERRRYPYPPIWTGLRESPVPRTHTMPQRQILRVLVTLGPSGRLRAGVQWVSRGRNLQTAATSRIPHPWSRLDLVCHDFGSVGW